MEEERCATSRRLPRKPDCEPEEHGPEHQRTEEVNRPERADRERDHARREQHDRIAEDLTDRFAPPRTGSIGTFAAAYCSRSRRASAQKCGGVQKKTIAKRQKAGTPRCPHLAAQPTSGGTAPGSTADDDVLRRGAWPQQPRVHDDVEEIAGLSARSAVSRLIVPASRGRTMRLQDSAARIRRCACRRDSPRSDRMESPWSSLLHQPVGASASSRWLRHASPQASASPANRIRNGGAGPAVDAPRSSHGARQEQQGHDHRGFVRVTVVAPGAAVEPRCRGTTRQSLTTAEAKASFACQRDVQRLRPDHGCRRRGRTASCGGRAREHLRRYADPPCRNEGA